MRCETILTSASIFGLIEVPKVGLFCEVTHDHFAKLNELHHAENPARVLLERPGWTHVPREKLAGERGDEREVLLKGRLWREHPIGSMRRELRKRAE